MKKILFPVLLSFLLSACDVWNAQPQPFPVWTAIPSRAPNIITATPLILFVTPITPEATFTPAPSETPIPTDTALPPTATVSATPAAALDVEILGCNTSIDITHGMGEVTNAYVTLKNIGGVDLPNACGLLRAIDEGREHPDKKVCVPNLPAQSQVTLKLTVDSTYKEGTIIQVDALSNDAVLLRIDKHACTDIGLFGGAPTNLNVIEPLP
ncbi:MAG: hypothetical protein Fur002_20720 [Anaerolineales bacterium]